MAQVAFMEKTKPFYMDGIFYQVKPVSANGPMARECFEKLNSQMEIVVAHHLIWASAGSKVEQGKALEKLILPAMNIRLKSIRIIVRRPLVRQQKFHYRRYYQAPHPNNGR